MYLYPEIERNPLLHLNITEPLRLGTARVLRQTPHGILAFERSAALHLLAADSFRAAEELLDGVDGVDFIMLSDAAFAPLLARYRLPGGMRCRQAALLDRDPPAPDPRLFIAPPDAPALARIVESYHMESPEALRRKAREGNLFFARDALGADVGFVGLHPEGCFGLLEVFPDQRRRGYGAALEGFILRRCAAQGRVPYCQVEEHNEASLRLQAKLGLRITPETLFFAWKPRFSPPNLTCAGT